MAVTVAGFTYTILTSVAFSQTTTEAAATSSADDKRCKRRLHSFIYTSRPPPPPATRAHVGSVGLLFLPVLGLNLSREGYLISSTVRPTVRLFIITAGR